MRARSRIDRDFYLCCKHYGCWYFKVVLGLPDAALAAQAGWSEAAVTAMVRTYAHAVDDRRLDEIDAAFETHSQTQPAGIPPGEPVRTNTAHPPRPGYGWRWLYVAR